MTREPERTADGRYVVVDGRRWRTADPDLPDDVRARLLHHLGVARSTVRTAGRAGDDKAVTAARARVQLAKTEKGPPCPPSLASSRRAPAGRPTASGG
jgi:hypothetical protein